MDHEFAVAGSAPVIAHIPGVHIDKVAFGHAGDEGALTAPGRGVTRDGEPNCFADSRAIIHGRDGEGVTALCATQDGRVGRARVTRDGAVGQPPADDRFALDLRALEERAVAVLGHLEHVVFGIVEGEGDGRKVGRDEAVSSIDGAS